MVRLDTDIMAGMNVLGVRTQTEGDRGCRVDCYYVISKPTHPSTWHYSIECDCTCPLGFLGREQKEVG